MADTEFNFTLPQTEESPKNQTRDAIANMSGFSSFDEVGKASPEQTTLSGMAEAPKKRGRKPGSKNTPKTEAETNPLMADKRYAEAVGRMAAFGGAKVIDSAFTITGAPLDAEEKMRVDDLTYVASKKYNLDPSQSPILMAIYTVVLLAQLILVRVVGTSSGAMWEQFRGIFGKKENDGDANES